MMIVEFEGIDGVGKTTQCRLLKAWFASQGQNALVVKDLESTEFGLHIRQKLVSDMPRANETELFAFLACKAHLMQSIILPELERGTHIICDRGIGSMISYFEALGFERRLLGQMLELAVPGVYRARTLFIELSPMVAMARKAEQGGNSKFDNMGQIFFNAQQAVFRDLAQDPSWQTLDGTLEPHELHAVVLKELQLV